MKKGICIIPARGGSKRVPHKNIKPFNGTTFLDLTINAVVQSNVFDKVVITSDDDQILEMASKYSKVDLHKRASELSDDKATVFEVFHHILQEHQTYDFIAGVLVTSPFKTSKHIEEAVNLYHSHAGTKNVISITNFEYPPQFGFRLDKNSSELTMIYPEVFNKTTNSKFMEPIVHNNGVIWVGSVKHYLENRTFYKGDLVGYEMDQLSSMDIDYPFQFEIAEILANKLNILNK